MSSKHPCLSGTAQPPDRLPSRPPNNRNAYFRLRRWLSWVLSCRGPSLVPDILIWGRRSKQRGQAAPGAPAAKESTAHSAEVPTLQTQHPANRQFQTSQRCPAQTPLPSSYWPLVKGRNDVIGFPISLPSALQDLGGSRRRPPLSIRGWRALIGVDTAETCPRRFLQTLGREAQGGAGRVGAGGLRSVSPGCVCLGRIGGLKRVGGESPLPDLPVPSHPYRSLGIAGPREGLLGLQPGVCRSSPGQCVLPLVCGAAAGVCRGKPGVWGGVCVWVAPGPLKSSDPLWTSPCLL